MDTFRFIAGLVVLGMMGYAIVVAWYYEIRKIINAKKNKNKKGE